LHQEHFELNSNFLPAWEGEAWRREKSWGEYTSQIRKLLLAPLLSFSRCEVVGIRSWLLKPYLEALETQMKELSNLKAEVEDLRERLRALEKVGQRVELLEERLKVLDYVSDSTKENRLWIKELLKDIENLKLEIEALKLKSEADSSNKAELDELDLEARVYDLIRKGQTSPTKIAQTLGISKDKLYRILKRLQDARLITTIGKGRKKKYVPVLEAENE